MICKASALGHCIRLLQLTPMRQVPCPTHLHLSTSALHSLNKHGHVAFYQAFEPGVCTEDACVSSNHANKNKQDCANNIVVAYVQCCFMGQVYRHAMRVHNRGSSAMKATLSLPPSVHPFLQAQPTTGFCQVCSTQQACVTQQLLQTLSSGLKFVA